MGIVEVKNNSQFYLNPRLYFAHISIISSSWTFVSSKNAPREKEFISYSDAACANLGQVLLLKPGHYSLSNLTQHNFSTIQI